MNVDCIVTDSEMFKLNKPYLTFISYFSFVFTRILIYCLHNIIIIVFGTFIVFISLYDIKNECNFNTKIAIDYINQSRFVT